jgi:hypothetical protein
MNDFEGQLHRTLVQLLLEHEYQHLAAIILDSGIELLNGWNDPIPYCVSLDIPASVYGMVVKDESSKEVLERAVRKDVLFFPLPLAVRADTGIMYKDHREVDFLVCVDGTWGILEV